MNIGIIGVGFVGGTTAEVLGKAHNIIKYDLYKPPFQDPEPLKESEAVFICVDTPMKLSGEIDSSSIYNSMETLTRVTKDCSQLPLVIIRSTAVSGTSDEIEKNYRFNVAFNPEFLREKSALQDMLSANRIIIGANRQGDYETVRSIYMPIFPEVKYFHFDRRTAETIKYASNAMLTAQIAVANEIYQICQHIGVDYNSVKEVLLLDDRIGRNIDVPGHDGDLGFGGKCFPKDLRALIHLSRENGWPPHLLEEIWRLNEKVRKDKDWVRIPGATSANKNFNK